MRILVIKLRHHGDVLLSSAVFSVLKTRYPKAQIDAYIYKETLPMLQGHPHIDQYILYDKSWKLKGKIRRWIREAKLLLQIRRSGYDLVINLTEGDRGAIVARVSRAKVRVGFDPEGSGMMHKKKCYTHLAKICPHLRHAVERNLDVLRAIGIFPEPQERELTFIPAISAPCELEDFILIHPVSRWLFKCWPEAQVSQLIDHLHSRGHRIVLTCSPDSKEMAMLKRIEQQASAPVINLGGKTSLKELGALIKRSRLLITVDSVPLHMASALKAPVVVIFGPTSEVNWAPYRNPNARVVAQKMSCRPCYRPGCADSGRSDCLETLSLETVLAAVDELDPQLV